MRDFILALLVSYVLGMPLAGVVAWMWRDDDLVLADIPAPNEWTQKQFENGMICQDGPFSYGGGDPDWGPKCKYRI